MRAAEFLSQARAEMEDRATTYDKPAGERSMAATVAAFNAVTGHSLTEEQGWKFMVCLKLVRSEQGAYRADNFVDGAAYFGLAGETADAGSKTEVNDNEPKTAAPKGERYFQRMWLPGLSDPKTSDASGGAQEAFEVWNGTTYELPVELVDESITTLAGRAETNYGPRGYWGTAE